ncbi:hypothetical protein C9374_007104 [Naegleria lovaniensis]|uniref:Uncharacterized protein n=1 Tax=Naegleria lovaniensis TaxID=51637 RepID=A0AA88GYW4_NAELO|nr:uncharacterized protein C9374_007104 [Naegleria lovaniensis]KAG2393573.1 hypothetical protein C9374_007104 [Naegleria lovaniensis]
MNRMLTLYYPLLEFAFSELQIESSFIIKACGMMGLSWIFADHLLLRFGVNQVILLRYHPTVLKHSKVLQHFDQQCTQHYERSFLEFGNVRVYRKSTKIGHHDDGECSIMTSSSTSGSNIENRGDDGANPMEYKYGQHIYREHAYSILYHHVFTRRGLKAIFNSSFLGLKVVMYLAKQGMQAVNELYFEDDEIELKISNEERIQQVRQALEQIETQISNIQNEAPIKNPDWIISVMSLFRVNGNEEDETNANQQHVDALEEMKSVLINELESLQLVEEYFPMHSTHYRHEKSPSHYMVPNLNWLLSKFLFSPIKTRRMFSLVDEIYGISEEKRRSNIFKHGFTYRMLSVALFALCSYLTESIANLEIFSFKQKIMMYGISMILQWSLIYHPLKTIATNVMYDESPFLDAEKKRQSNKNAKDGWWEENISRTFSTWYQCANDIYKDQGIIGFFRASHVGVVLQMISNWRNSK